MNFTKELKKDWLDALKSGKYKKGTDRLRNNENNTFCCLGVLCEILPNYKIDKTGNAVESIEGEMTAGYSVFEGLFSMIGDLHYINDKYPNDNFENVIPIIEAKPTVD